MAQPWKILETVETADGVLELRQRGARDFLITLDNLVLMNSLANRSEIVLGQVGCAGLMDHPAPRVLVGGLGMGCTLRAVLDSLPPSATVTVAELNPVVVQWSRGPLAELTGAAADDPRVTIEIADVAKVVTRAAKCGKTARFDAIVFDLYRGPHFRTDREGDPLYGRRAIERARDALVPGGLFAIWGENYDEGFAERLKVAGFDVRHEKPGRGGYRHVVFLARRPVGVPPKKN